MKSKPDPESAHDAQDSAKSADSALSTNDTLMSLSVSQILQLALECGFDEFADCEVMENNTLREVDTVFMGDTASLVQFAEQLYNYWNQHANLPHQG